MNIFHLQWTWYDSQQDFYFAAPEGGATLSEFSDLCDRLAREAALDGINSIHRSPSHETGSKTWIGYDYLAEEIAARLPQHGYTPVEFPKVRYCGTSIIKDESDYKADEVPNIDDDAYAAVAKFNAEFAAELRGS